MTVRTVSKFNAQGWSIVRVGSGAYPPRTLVLGRYVEYWRGYPASQKAALGLGGLPRGFPLAGAACEASKACALAPTRDGIPSPPLNNARRPIH